MPPREGASASTRDQVASGTKVPESPGLKKISPSKADKSQTTSPAFRELQKYGTNILPRDAIGNGDSPPPPLGVDDEDASLREERLERDNDGRFEGGFDAHRDDVMKCREAVEVLTRNPKRSALPVHFSMFWW